MLLSLRLLINEIKVILMILSTAELLFTEFDKCCRVNRYLVMNR